MDQSQKRSQHRFSPGPRVVKRSISFPPDLLDALITVAAQEPHRNVSRIVVLAVTEYLNRQYDRRAA